MRETGDSGKEMEIKKLERKIETHEKIIGQAKEEIKRIEERA